MHEMPGANCNFVNQERHSISILGLFVSPNQESKTFSILGGRIKYDCQVISF